MANRIDWSLFKKKCLLCGHPNCPECREVSFSLLACCKCRAKALKLIEAIKERQNAVGGAE